MESVRHKTCKMLRIRNEERFGIIMVNICLMIRQEKDKIQRKDKIGIIVTRHMVTRSMMTSMMLTKFPVSQFLFFFPPFFTPYI